MNNRILPVLFALLFASLATSAQKNRPKFKFGDVKANDFIPTHYKVDSTADAVYLFETGVSTIVGNNKGFFSIEHTTHVRIRLLKKNAFDLATVALNIYVNGNDPHRLDKLEAATYNLENGKVVATKLDKASIFREKSEGYQTHKFTFPNIREGSIIEYAFTSVIPSIELMPSWKYQGDYPRLWSEYEVNIPSLFDYAFVKQGYHPYVIDTAIASYGSLYISEDGGAGPSQNYTWSGNTIRSIWAMENVPAIKTEPFITTLRNYVAKIEFQLSAIRYPDMPPKHYLRSWSEVAVELMKHEDFGLGLEERTSWMDNEIKKLADPNDDLLERAKRIYRYVRDNYTCTDNYGIWRSQPLKKTYQTKKGNVADLNLLLTSMLINQGFNVHPVLLSTREHGRAVETYPIISKFNYVLCRVVIDDVCYNLDASGSLGFGKLSGECYNGTGRLIDKVPVLVSLSADSLSEKNSTIVFLSKEKDGLKGTVVNNLGSFASANLRSKLKTTKQDEYFKDLKKGFSQEVEMSNAGIDSLSQLEEPVDCHYDVSFDFKDEPLVYFNPLVGFAAQRENPFKAAERHYPVEMPYCIDDSYVLTMDIPDGYKVEELPKSARVNLNETEGKFEYIIAAGGNLVQMRYRLMLNKTIFEPADYQTLREFFGYVVKKTQEQIVFKKVKE